MGATVKRASSIFRILIDVSLVRDNIEALGTNLSGARWFFLSEHTWHAWQLDCSLKQKVNYLIKTWSVAPCKSSVENWPFFWWKPKKQRSKKLCCLIVHDSCSTECENASHEKQGATIIELKPILLTMWFYLDLLFKCCSLNIHFLKGQGRIIWPDIFIIVISVKAYCPSKPWQITQWKGIFTSL